jgi:CubicO group peptidase (beta-lactamase class C family)
VKVGHLITQFGIAVLMLLGTGRFAAQDIPPPFQSSSGGDDQQIDTRKFDLIEPLVKQAIDEKKLPGAVVLIGRGDRILYQKAIGNRAVAPAVEPMTLDTMFDLASLTKVVATTTSVMMLVEEGKIRLNDRVSTFIPGFERYGKGTSRSGI